jgi:hypothetical protein
VRPTAVSLLLVPPVSKFLEGLLLDFFFGRKAGGSSGGRSLALIDILLKEFGVFFDGYFFFGDFFDWGYGYYLVVRFTDINLDN